jgi:hypothetical protein
MNDDRQRDRTVDLSVQSQQRWPLTVNLNKIGRTSCSRSLIRVGRQSNVTRREARCKKLRPQCTQSNRLNLFERIICTSQKLESVIEEISEQLESTSHTPMLVTGILKNWTATAPSRSVWFAQWNSNPLCCTRIELRKTSDEKSPVG